MTLPPARPVGPRAKLAAWDPVVVTFAKLRADIDQIRGLSGDPLRIAGIVQPPFPRLLVRRLPPTSEVVTWLATHSVRITGYDDPEGSHGDAAIRDMVYDALESLRELPQLPYVDSAVITGFATSGAAPTTETGRASAPWAATVTLRGHPNPDTPGVLTT